jgi:hypothetical protein
MHAMIEKLETIIHWDQAAWAKLTDKSINSNRIVSPIRMCLLSVFKSTCEISCLKASLDEHYSSRRGQIVKFLCLERIIIKTYDKRSELNTLP